MRMPHLTTCVSITAAGQTFKPLIILPNKKKLGDLEDFIPLANFATSSSGWMTKTIFTIWVIYFVAEIQLYRLSLPKDIRDDRILLIVDGHSSRINLDALIILYLFDIDCLILPGHSSHVLQLFVLTVA